MISLKKLFRPRTILIAALGLASVVLGGLVGTYVAVKKTVPDVSALETFEPSLLTAIYADDGRIVKEIGPEKRIVVTYDQIPVVLRNAILATEDPRFFKHKGVDMRGAPPGGQGERPPRFQQAQARGREHHHPAAGPEALPPSPADPPAQAGRMVHLAVQIEKRYSKEKIFEMYCNQFELGHGAYGVEAAAHLFFGKGVAELNLEEAAMIAGIFRGPSRYSPYTPSGADARAAQPRPDPDGRGEASSPPAEAEEAEEEAPERPAPRPRGQPISGPIFFEEVRKYIVATYGEDALYPGRTEGLYDAERRATRPLAEDALDKGLRDLDKRRGWRKDKLNCPEDKAFLKKRNTLDDYWLRSWTTPRLEPGRHRSRPSS